MLKFGLSYSQRDPFVPITRRDEGLKSEFNVWDFKSEVLLKVDRESVLAINLVLDNFRDLEWKDLGDKLM